MDGYQSLSLHPIPLVENIVVNTPGYRTVSGNVLTRDGRLLIRCVLDTLTRWHIHHQPYGDVSVDTIMVNTELTPDDLPKFTVKLTQHPNLPGASKEKHWDNLYRGLKGLALSVRQLLEQQDLPYDSYFGQTIPKDLEHWLGLIEGNKWDALIVILGHPCTFDWYEQVIVISSLRMRHQANPNLYTPTYGIPDQVDWELRWALFMPHKEQIECNNDNDLLLHLREVFEHKVEVVEVNLVNGEEPWVLTEAKKMHCIFPDFLSLYFENARDNKLTVCFCHGLLRRDIMRPPRNSMLVPQFIPENSD